MKYEIKPFVMLDDIEGIYEFARENPSPVQFSVDTIRIGYPIVDYSVENHRDFPTLDNKIEVMQRKADGLEREIHYRNERMKRMCGRIIDDMKAENAAAAKQLNEVLTELSQLREEKARQVA